MNNFIASSLIILSLGMGYFVAKPMFAEIDNLSLKEEEYKTALESLSTLESIKQTLTQKLESLSPEEQERIMISMPTSSDTVKLVSDLDAVAGRHGLSIENVLSSPVNNTSQSVAESASPAAYKSELISFTFSGSYEKLKSFLSDVESNMRIMDVRSVSITAKEGGINDYKISGEVYWLP
jgi:Tfp pilus assembly protein PilO